MDPDRPPASSGTETGHEPEEPSSPADPARPDDTMTLEANGHDQPSLLGRLLGWSNGVAAPEASEPVDTLGPAFRESSPAELAMVRNILRLRDLRVEDVMTPRADIAAVDEAASLEEVTEASETGSHSRLPVYRDTLDDPIGFVHMKDLAVRYGFARNADTTNFQLSAHVRPAIFVPPSMRIAALLQKMQGERVHMALVIDEFGGVDGLVTIEDLVEAIVGDIEDEHDREDADGWALESPGVWQVQARADIRAFEEANGLSIVPEDWDEDVETLGGLVFMLANRVPTRGEVISHPNGYEFEIVDADPRRIKRLRLRLGNGYAGLRQAAE